MPLCSAERKKTENQCLFVKSFKRRQNKILQDFLVIITVNIQYVKYCTSRSGVYLPVVLKKAKISEI